MKINNHFHCVKSVRIRSYSGLHFPAFEVSTERYGVSFRIQSDCGKMRTRIIPNTDTFYAVFETKVVGMKLNLVGNENQQRFYKIDQKLHSKHSITNNKN